MTTTAWTIWTIGWAQFAYKRHHVLSPLKEKVTSHG